MEQQHCQARHHTCCQLPLLPAARSDRIQQKGDQRCLMKQRGQKHQYHKACILPSQKTGHRKKRQRQRKIIPHGIKALEIIPEHHEQEEREAEVLCLLPDHRQHRKDGHHGINGKQQQIVFIAAETVYRLGEPVEAGFRRYIGIN